MVYFKFEFGFGSGKKKETRATSDCERVGWDIVNSEVERLKSKGQYKTASNYLTAARSWSKFLSNEKWSFADMTASLVEAYQRWLGERGICPNTISAYMRALRALYYRVTTSEVITSDQNHPQVMTKACHKLPFEKVFTGRAKTQKRSVTAEEILRLHHLALPEGSYLSLTRDIFMFSFYAMGMPFVDIAHLKKKQVKADVIHYARHKTGQPIRVLIMPPMRKMMERYDNPQSEYVFPILAEAQSGEDLHRCYRNSLRRYNYSLHRLSHLLGLSRPLSSYVVRHSWASIAYQHHVDVGLIGKALGHTKTSTTLLYIRSLFDPDLADANQSLMQALGF